MHHRFALCAAVALLATPIAVADGIATYVEWTEADASCWHGDGSYEDANGYRRWWGAGCADRFDYARAGAAGAGHSAGVRAGADEKSGWSHHAGESWGGWSDNESSSSWWSRDEQGAYAQGWSRGASANLDGTRVGVERGCWAADEETSTWSARQYSYSGGHGWYGESASRSADAQACDVRADADHDGQHRSVLLRDGCESSTTSGYRESSSTWDGMTYHAQESFAHERHACGQRASTAGTPADVAAGAGDGCTRSASDGWWYSSDSSSSWSGAGSSSWEECARGASASGPDGMHLFLGHARSSDTSCSGAGDERTCSTWTYERAGVVLAWRHNPLGPSDVALVVPLP